ncbi:F-type H+-transporting ATPase subunit epsilon [Syntrophus gentianae]|uniref:ATP synthase epsilon chain n=1 Tax=Syntrophus gentianae TaxID=43775 RepID=A0A1H7VNU5_9BACT|nr:F0F1 ATP synthase subunit epsilon [Syntrophus gentianae]SEM10505.1 F-type H+-transporting ATPase subunit epsilon [Syntrophus gentianae]
MNLKIFLPSQVLMEEKVSKIVAEGAEGSFGLLPGHIDFTTALVPGLLAIFSTKGQKELLAIDEGVLVKRGPDVWISTRNAVRNTDLGRAKHLVEEQFKTLDEREKMARSATAKLEADIIRRFMELKKNV